MSPTPIAVAVVRHAGCVLIGQRPAGAALAGLWEFPGGKVEPGETPENAAARECREETGVAIRVGAAYPRTIFQYAHDRVELHFFAAVPVDPGQTPRPPFRWTPIEDLHRYEFPAANAPLVEHLQTVGCD
jgi:8-oxo-dGTP diphosphatase